VRFSFEFLDKRLRIRSILREQVTAITGMPAPTDSSGLETAILCTGENADDHHGMKFPGGMPGGRMIYSGQEESRTATGRRMVLTQFDPSPALKVESVYDSFENVPVIRRFTRVTNLGTQAVGIEYLSSAVLHNLASPRGLQHRRAGGHGIARGQFRPGLA
jgi:alpha-galactosidase